MICPRLRATGDKSYTSDLLKLAEANDGTEAARPMVQMALAIRIQTGSEKGTRDNKVFHGFFLPRDSGKAVPPLFGAHGSHGFSCDRKTGQDPLSEEACCEIAMGFRSQRDSIRKEGMLASF